MSLVETLIALGISSLILISAISFIESFYVQNVMSKEDEEIIALKDEIMAQMSCAETIWKSGGGLVDECNFAVGKGCKEKNYLAIKSVRLNIGSGAAPRVIVKDRDLKLDASDYSSFKRLDVRASCTCCPECAAGKKLMIEYRLIRKGGADSWKDLFKGIPLKCVVMG